MNSHLKTLGVYGFDDVEPVMQHFAGIGYYRQFCFEKGICGKYMEAGHILGSAIVELDLDANTLRLAGSGRVVSTLRPSDCLSSPKMNAAVPSESTAPLPMPSTYVP